MFYSGAKDPLKSTGEGEEKKREVVMIMNLLPWLYEGRADIMYFVIKSFIASGK